jgi:hypothetical protein
MKLSISITTALLALVPASAAPVQLWATFDQGTIGAFSNISIPLTAGSWRVGSSTGPVASSALIAQVLGNLTDVRVGGLGNAVKLIDGTQSFGFFLTNPNLGGAAVEDFDPYDFGAWGFTAFDDPLGIGTEPGFGAPGGSVSVTSFNATPETFIGFIFSSLFHGDQSAAFGNNFTFRWLPAEGYSFTPEYVLVGGGRAILTGDVDTTVPEPGTLLSAAAALGLVALRLRRQ